MLETSSMFGNVNLTAPIIFDNEENKERFSLRLQLMMNKTAEGDITDFGQAPGTRL